LFHGIHGLPCLILRTSRFFPEPDDREETRRSYDDVNVKVNELLYRRADIEDVVAAHLLALEKAQALGFGRYIVSATTPFTRDDVRELRTNAARVVSRRVPRYEDVYAHRGWSMFPGIDRLYINERARRELGWKPRYDFAHVIDLVSGGEDPRSPLARAVGSKGYHAVAFADGPYPLD
jgi:UDP-glucose 4-epimerase